MVRALPQDRSDPHTLRGSHVRRPHLPAPIPRSVTFDVKHEWKAPTAAPHPSGGLSKWRESTIRVSCSISGETWGESEVDEVEVHHEGRETPPAELLRACRERWAIVRALVLGHSDLSALLTGPRAVELLAQRDAVYAALAAQALLEVEMLAAQQATVAAIASPRLTAVETRPEDRPSAQALAVYFERLIEQAGALS